MAIDSWIKTSEQKPPSRRIVEGLWNYTSLDRELFGWWVRQSFYDEDMFGSRGAWYILVGETTQWVQQEPVYWRIPNDLPPLPTN